MKHTIRVDMKDRRKMDYVMAMALFIIRKAESTQANGKTTGCMAKEHSTTTIN